MRINLATTFNEDGYYHYGQQWIDTIIKYWPEETRVTLYVDFDIPELPDNFNIVSFSDTFPNHQEFAQNVKEHFTKKFPPNLQSKAINFSRLTIKFSHKALVIDRELTRNDAGYFVWLDGDVETCANITYADVSNALGEKFLACQMERQGSRHPHVESGILIFNLLHKTTHEFQKKFNQYYYTDKLFEIRKPYDGYVIGAILKDNQFDYVDFNSKFAVPGLMSTKETTFLHPFLKQRFVHWIAESKNLL